MNLIPLYEIVAEYRQKAEQLAELDLDDLTLADTLESIQWPIEQKATAISAVIGNMDAAAEMRKAFGQRKIDEAKRMQARADHLRQYLLDNMLACGISEITANDGSMTIKAKQNPPKVIIDDAGKIPASLYEYPVAPDPYPNKKAISERLKAGDHIDGAHLERGMRLVIS